MILSDLIRPLTRDEAIARIYAAAAARGLPTTSWKSGAVVRTIIAGVGFVVSAFSELQVTITRGGFLQLAVGDWLTLVALYVYDVVRSEGSFASGTIVLDNTGGGVFSGAAGDLIFYVGSTQKEYRNTGPFSISAMQTGVAVSITAVELGSGSTTAANTIDGMRTPLSGVVIASGRNPAALVGNDPEDDATLRLRCAEKTGVASPNGPRDAYAFVARSTLDANGASIGVNRVSCIPDGVGGIDVYVATPSGTVSGPNVALIDAEIQTRVTPLAIAVTVQSAAALTVAVTYEIWVRDTTTLTDQQIEDAIAARLVSFITSRPIGGDIISPSAGKVYKSAIAAQIGDTIPDTVRVDVTTPGSDVSATTTQAPVAGSFVATAIHRVPGATI